jgi:hypothetical protein
MAGLVLIKPLYDDAGPRVIQRVLPGLEPGIQEERHADEISPARQALSRSHRAGMHWSSPCMTAPTRGGYATRIARRTRLRSSP